MTKEEGLEALAECRERIDAVDLKLLALLNERTGIVEQIGRVKQDAQMPIYEPRREEQVFENVLARNASPLPGDAVRRIFERIIDEMRQVQRLRMLDKTHI